MTFDDFINNLETAIERTVEDLRPTMEEAALTGKALLARRVQNSGFGKRYRSRGYVRLRARRGFEIRFVNLTYTGKMFQNWKRPGNYRNALKVGGFVGGTDLETQNKLRWNKMRYPSFDRLNDDEKQLLSENLVKPRIVEFMKQNLSR